MTPKKKEEFNTHLSGDKLVPKTHPRIALRGSLDKLEAVILEAQLRALSEGNEEMVGLLGEMVGLIGEIFKAEVREEKLPPVVLFGLKADEIREHSHYPHKYYGIKHFQPLPKHGKLMSALNLVRVYAREAELKALEAFFDPEKGLEREDIVIALNRLSSAAYILMCRLAKKIGLGEEKFK